MDEISAIRHKQAKLIVTGHAEDKRVAISVDAQGRIVGTRFAEDIGDLSYDEIAAAVTAAGQAAQDALAARTEEILRPLREQQARLPKITDLVAGLSDVETYAPVVPTRPNIPPGPSASGDEAARPETGSPGVRESLW
ncbi:YbaB/EbfC family nucleoid-associated protein [Nocardia asiatica]